MTDAQWRDVEVWAVESRIPVGGVANIAAFTTVTTKLRVEFTHRGEARSGVTEFKVWRGLPSL